MRLGAAQTAASLIYDAALSPASTPKQRIAASESSITPRALIQGVSNPPVTLQAHMEQLHIVGISVAVFNAGKIEWAKAYGYADKKRSVRATPDALFEAGSISNTLAALATLELVEKGTLDLNANVNDKLKSWQLPDKHGEYSVTRRHTDGKGNTEAIRVWKESRASVGGTPEAATPSCKCS